MHPVREEKTHDPIEAQPAANVSIPEKKNPPMPEEVRERGGDKNVIRPPVSAKESEADRKPTHAPRAHGLAGGGVWDIPARESLSSRLCSCHPRRTRTAPRRHMWVTRPSRSQPLLKPPLDPPYA